MWANLCGDQVVYSLNISGKLLEYKVWFLMAKIIVKKETACSFSCCIYKRKQFWQVLYSVGRLLAFVWHFQNLTPAQIPREASPGFWISFWAQAWALARCTALEPERNSGCKAQWKPGYPRCSEVKLSGVNGAYESAHLGVCWTGVFSITCGCTLNCFAGSCLSCDHFLGYFTPRGVCMNSSEGEAIRAWP